jgi:3-oxoacyl-[acyl-carrier protein] reductase
MAELDGQIAVVTGAGQGIGEAASKKLACMGAFVVLLARDLHRLRKVKDEIEAVGGRAETHQVDLLDQSAITSFGDAVRERYGRCEILVNNAGVSLQGKPLYETTPEDWDRMMGTNLRAPYLMIRALAPLMKDAGRGHIINVSSLAGHNPLKNGAAYAASKWGLNGLTYSVAEELRDHGVRVSVVAPGSVNTGFGRSPGDGSWKIQPDDVANIIALLVTQSSNSFVSEVLVRPARKP